MPPKPAWLFNQSAVIPYRRSDDAIEVALVTSRRRRRWVIPKGVIDPGQDAATSAAREAEEEAGLVGSVQAPSVGRYTYEKWGGTCRVEVFLMAVEVELERWEEDGIRTRRWYALEDAATRVDEPALAALIRRIPALLAVDGRP